MRKKILFAVGGTGGHLFPAQALAKELREMGGEIEILFGGGRLGENPFFQKELFAFKEVCGGSPFRGNPFSSAFKLARGVQQSIKICKDFSPDLIVGFGSFYSFPLLAAAKMKKVPIFLVEANALPGKVNTLFSAKAKLCAIQFQESAEHFKGMSSVVKMPIWSKEAHPITKEEARRSYGLGEKTFTLLVFGGSQGARAINEAMFDADLQFPYQVIHFTGDEADLKKRYQERGVNCVIKPFEKEMHKAWRAADLAICRAGAGTLAEILAFEVPAILVPWPGASDNHQLKNAYAMEKRGCALVLEQYRINELGDEICAAREKIEEMKEKLHETNRSNAALNLSCHIMTTLEELG